MPQNSKNRHRSINQHLTTPPPTKPHDKSFPKWKNPVEMKRKHKQTDTSFPLTHRSLPRSGLFIRSSPDHNHQHHHQRHSESNPHISPLAHLPPQIIIIDRPKINNRQSRSHSQQNQPKNLHITSYFDLKVIKRDKITQTSATIKHPSPIHTFKPNSAATRKSVIRSHNRFFKSNSRSLTKTRSSFFPKTEYLSSKKQ